MMQTKEEQICTLSRAHLSLAAIAREVGLSTSQVVRIRKKHGLSKFTVKRLTAEELRFAEQLLKDGASYQEVGRTLHRHPSIIHRKIPGYGWTYADQAEYSKVRREHGLIQSRGEWEWK